MRSFNSVLLITFLAFCAAAQSKAPAAWESKPIDKWDERDIHAIMAESAWGQAMVDMNAQSDTGMNIGLTSPTRVLFTLRSSLIVRYALIRQRQLKAGYDSMDDKAKAEFDRKNKTTLECPACSEFYVVSITGASAVLKNPAVIKSREQSIVLVNEKGEKRPLAKFIPQTTPDSEAMFFFKRNDEKGKPLLTAQNRTVTFVFPTSLSDDLVVGMVRSVEIKVADITRDGQVIF